MYMYLQLCSLQCLLIEMLRYGEEVTMTIVHLRLAKPCHNASTTISHANNQYVLTVLNLLITAHVNRNG